MRDAPGAVEAASGLMAESNPRVGELGAPALLVVGSEDTTVPPFIVEGLQRTICASARISSEYVVVPGASHSEALNEATGQAIEWARAALEDRTPRTCAAP